MGSRADPQRARAFLERQGVPFQADAAGGLTIAPAEACGVLVEFLPA